MSWNSGQRGCCKTLETELAQAHRVYGDRADSAHLAHMTNPDPEV